MTENAADLLERLEPPLINDNLTVHEVCNYLGIGRSTLLGLTRIHSPELKEAGYVGSNKHAYSRFSRRSVIHLAMMLRPSTSHQANEIKKALGVYQPPRNVQHRMAGHVTACKTQLDKAMELGQAVQEYDPQETWQELSEMGRWHLQVIIVALGAMLPLDQPGLLSFLQDCGENVPMCTRASQTNAHRGDSAGRGLAALIPQTKGEAEDAGLI